MSYSHIVSVSLWATFDQFQGGFARIWLACEHSKQTFTEPACFVSANQEGLQAGGIYLLTYSLILIAIAWLVHNPSDVNNLKSAIFASGSSLSSVTSLFQLFSSSPVTKKRKRLIPKSPSRCTNVNICYLSLSVFLPLQLYRYLFCHCLCW